MQSDYRNPAFWEHTFLGRNPNAMQKRSAPFLALEWFGASARFQKGSGRVLEGFWQGCCWGYHLGVCLKTNHGKSMQTSGKTLHTPRNPQQMHAHCGQIHAHSRQIHANFQQLRTLKGPAPSSNPRQCRVCCCCLCPPRGRSTRRCLCTWRWGERDACGAVGWATVVTTRA